MGISQSGLRKVNLYDANDEKLINLDDDIFEEVCVCMYDVYVLLHVFAHLLFDSICICVCMYVCMCVYMYVCDINSQQ